MSKLAIIGSGILILLLAGCGSALDCNCGDICMNETGWWRDGGAFNSSLTPIQAAVDNANENDVICAKDGTYSDNVDVKTAHLTIKSENGAATTTVHAASSNDNVFDITADYVNIRGFTVMGATDANKVGVRIGNSVDQCTITQNNITGNRYGIYLLSSSTHNNITCNIISSNTNDGIRFTANSAKYNNITHNTITQNNRGIYSRSADENNISCNYIAFNTECGIRLTSHSIGNTIECNNIIANGVLQADGSYHWQFYNDQEEDVSATNNWWGTADDNEINASIYDWQDNSDKGNVTYLPKLGGPSSCAEIPEPATLVMVAFGLIGVIGVVYRSRKCDR